jgi:NADH-quinone oxidoreductase subunit E
MESRIKFQVQAGDAAGGGGSGPGAGATVHPAPAGALGDGKPMRLSDAAVAELERLRTRYANREALMLPALWMVQEEHGWISEEAMLHVAEVLGVSPVRVYSVVSFYHMYHESPPGRYNVQVCHNLSCSLLGAEKLLDLLHQRLGVGENEPTPDGKFMVQRVECLGACEHAPCAQLNDKFLFDLTPAKLSDILEGLP